MPHLSTAVQQIASKLSGLIQQETLLSLTVSADQEFEKGWACRFWPGVSGTGVTCWPRRSFLRRELAWLWWDS